MPGRRRGILCVSAAYILAVNFLRVADAGVGGERSRSNEVCWLSRGSVRCCRSGELSFWKVLSIVFWDAHAVLRCDKGVRCGGCE